MVEGGALSRLHQSLFFLGFRVFRKVKSFEPIELILFSGGVSHIEMVDYLAGCYRIDHGLTAADSADLSSLAYILL